MHGRHGKITSINEQYGSTGTHASITVSHGKRKRRKGDDGKTTGPLEDFGRHTSNIVIPKAHASNYKLGQKVHIGIQPSEGMPDDADDDQDEGNEAAQVAPEAKAVPGKQSPIKKSASVQAKGRIAQALGKKRR